MSTELAAAPHSPSWSQASKSPRLLWAAAALAAAIAIFAPIKPASVSLTADYVAPSGSGYARFIGQAQLSTRRSLWSGWIHGGIDPERAELALKIAVSTALAEATPDVAQGFTPDDAWVRRLSELCERSMGDALGGSWTARVPAHQIMPSESPPDQGSGGQIA